MPSQGVRPGFQTVVPYLCAQGAAQLVDFLKAAFGAQHTFIAPTGKHFEVRIGDSMVMIGEAGTGAPQIGHIFMYVEEPEALYRRAIEAGATSVMEPCDRPWGEDEAIMRGAGVKDRAGNVWYLAGPK